MNKNDFLDILRDYLKGTFSQLEINDILRDYEEFFLNGESQGKSDEEIIKGLGSPKSIAEELIEEMKGHRTESGSNNSEVFDNINREVKRAWKNTKVTGSKARNKAREFLDSNSVINGNISSAGIKIIIAIITIAIVIAAMPVIFTLLGSLLVLVGMSIANFIGYLGSTVLCGISLPMGVFGFFACITWTGFLILGWILYVLAYKGLKYLWVRYISWVRTRKMYVRVKEQQESNSKDGSIDFDKINTNETSVMNSNEVEITEPILIEEIKDGGSDGDNKEVRNHDE